MKRKLSVLFILFLFFVGACATTMDYKISYLTMRDSYNSALRNYSERVKAMPVGTEKDQIKADFNPIWKDAEEALDLWGAGVKGATTQDSAESIRQFTVAKNKLIKLGVKYFGDSLFGE
jgi:hypothetical protein